MNADALEWLQQWYLSHCNRDWEHQYGISIENLDNPGWHLTVDLVGTELQWREFQELAIERTSEDWVRCKITGTRDVPKFEAHGGALNLSEMIEIFRRWVQGKP
jgi:hypothetical protein